MKPRPTPMRTCIACGLATDKRELVRVYRTPDGEVSVDPTGKANGRGAYVCPRSACFERAVSRKRFASALRVTPSEEDVERLRQEFERTLAMASDTTDRPGR